MNLTKAALNALAFAHLTGRMPKYIRLNTWHVVYNCLEGTALEYQLKPECLPLVAEHPMVTAVRQLEAEGWRIDKSGYHVKVRQGVGLVREVGDKRQETRVWPSGKQGRIFG